MFKQNIQFLTSREKMSSLGKHQRVGDRMEGDPNAFISVLINGNCFQVLFSGDVLDARWSLMLSATLVSRQLRVQWQNWRHRSCHSADACHRRMATQMAVRGHASDDPRLRQSRMAQRCLLRCERDTQPRKFWMVPSRLQQRRIIS